jgi:hypothetical protein
MSSTAPSQGDATVKTPWCCGPKLTYARKTCAMMEPSLPAAAEMPAQVQRYFVGKTSAEICHRQR